MSRQIIIICISILILAGAVLVLAQKNRTETNRATTNTGLITNTAVDLSSDKLGISLRPPDNWIVDRQLESQGTISMSSGILTLENQKTIGNLAVNRRDDNSDRLAPQGWFDRVIAPNVDTLYRIGVGTTGTYPTYSVIVSELRENRHIFIFSETRVIEIVFPNNQPAFQTNYENVLTSLRIF